MNRLPVAMALILCLALPLPGASVLGLFPEDFFQGQQITAPALSPDGERVLWVNQGLSGSSLEVFHFESGKSRKLWSSNHLGPPINDVIWASEERVVFQLGFGDIAAMNIDGSDYKQLYKAGQLLWTWNVMLWGNFSLPRIESSLPRDPDNILMSYLGRKGRRHLYRLNVHSGETEMAEKDRWGSTIWLPGTDETIRAAIVVRRNEVEFHYVDSGNGKWREIDRALGSELELSFARTGKSLAGQQDHGLAIDSGSKLYYTSSKGRDTWGLYSLDLTKPDSVKQIYVNERYDVPDPSLPLMFERETLIGLLYQAEKLEQVWLDREFEEKQARIDELSPDLINVITDWDDGKRRFIVHSFSDVQPGQFSYYDSVADQLLPIGKPSQRLSSEDLSPMQVIHYEVADGLTIEGYLTLPREGKPPYPTVALVHGGPWVRDIWGYNPEAQMLAYNGMAVLQVNFRGSSGYGYAHRNAIRENIAAGPINDVLAGLEWAIEKGYTDEERLAVMGFSYGGYAALMAAAMHPGKFKACIAGAAPSDLVEMLKGLRKENRQSYEFWKESLGYGNNEAVLEALSPVNLVAAISDPVFLFHGLLDNVVPYSQYVAMKEALEAANKEADFLVMEQEGHGITQRKEIVRTNGRILRFLDEHLKKHSE